MGLEVEVISADREARLAFSSIQNAFHLIGKNVILADIGGGSTEIVFATGNLIEAIFTTPLGAVRLTEQHGLAEAHSPEAYQPYPAALSVVSCVICRADASLQLAILRNQLREHRSVFSLPSLTRQAL